jgi:large subunit ribosomal protein L22
MDFKVVTKYIRMSPRKVRPVLHHLVAMDVSHAMNVMKYTKRGIALDVYKALKSAKANAVIKNPDVKTLWVKKLSVDSGPTLKRFKSISRGRASKILKRTSHLTLVITDQPVSAGGRA